jgi:hypothetical protein
MPNDKQVLVAAWIALHHAKAKSPEYDKNFWAFTALSDLCETNPDSCWELIEEIRSSDGSDVILANLAAGPLEDLLVYHGGRFIERIEELARNDGQYRKLLGAMWQNEIPDDVWERVKRVAGPSF